MDKIHEKIFHKRYTDDKHMKRCSTTLTISEMQIKTTKRNHYTPPRIAKTKNSDRSSHCGTTGSVPFLQHQDTDSIFGPAQWVKDLALQQLQEEEKINKIVTTPNTDNDSEKLDHPYIAGGNVIW